MGFIQHTVTPQGCKIDDSSGFWHNLIYNDSCHIYSFTFTVIYSVFYAFIFCLGIFFNGGVIGILICKQRMRRIINSRFILSLAAANLLVIFLCMPFNLVTNIYGPWIMGSTVCKTVAYFQGISVFTSGFSLVALSFDRCLAIVNSTGPAPHGLSRLQSNLIIIMIWSLAFLLYLPWPYVYQVGYDRSDHLLYCMENWGSLVLEKFYFLIGNLTISFILPLLLIIIFNSIIYVNLDDPDYGRSSPEIRRRNETRQQVLKMLVILTCAFFVCWFPLWFVVSKVKFFDGFDDDILKVFVPMAQLLAAVNSCINPVLFAWLNPKFREAIGPYLTFKRGENNENRVVNNPPIVRNCAIRMANQNRESPILW